MAVLCAVGAFYGEYHAVDGTKQSLKWLGLHRDRAIEQCESECFESAGEGLLR